MLQNFYLMSVFIDGQQPTSRVFLITKYTIVENKTCEHKLH